MHMVCICVHLNIWIKIIQTKIENNETSCGKAKLRNKWSYVANTMLIKKVSKNIITTVTVMITSVYFHLDDSYLLKLYIYGEITFDFIF